MKKCTLFLFMLNLCFAAQAQITLNHWDFTLNPNGDTVFLSDYDITGMPLPATGENMVWDYSNGVEIGSSQLMYESTTNANYPNANMRYATTTALVGLPFPLPTYGYVQYDNQQVSYLGIDIPAVAIPLGSFTGNPNDTLYNIGASRTESNPWTFAHFPMNYNDSSTLTSVSIHPVVVDAPTYGLNNYAVNQSIYTTVNTKISGWGYLILTNPATMMPDTFEVLLQERIHTRVDSFFDATNTPVSASLLSVLGLSQGSSSGGYTYFDFFAKGVNYRAMRIFKTNGGTIDHVNINAEIFATAFNVDTEEQQTVSYIKHRVFPKPIRNGYFQLEIDKNDNESWQFELYNVVGQMVHQEQIIDNYSTVYLDSNLSKGYYAYVVKNEKGQIVANGKLTL